jgi:futalosine hydrolase
VSRRDRCEVGTKTTHIAPSLNYGPAMLLVAATALELAALDGLETFVCGVGPVEAAAATSRRLAADPPPRIVVNVGIAGARELDPGTLVLGSEAVYCDLTGQPATVPLVGRVSADESLLALAKRALPDARVLPIGTAARVGGAADRADVEAMEGFAVLRAAEQAGVPALELRAVSNRYRDNRDDWQVEQALAALAGAVRRLAEALDA